MTGRFFFDLEPRNAVVVGTLCEHMVANGAMAIDLVPPAVAHASGGFWPASDVVKDD